MTAEQKLTEIINFLRWGSIDYVDYNYSMESTKTSKIKLNIQLKGYGGKDLDHLKYFLDHSPYITKPDPQIYPGTTVILFIEDDDWAELLTSFLAQGFNLKLKELKETVDIIKIMDTPSPESTASITFRFEPNVPPGTQKLMVNDLRFCSPSRRTIAGYDVQLKDTIILPNNRIYMEFNITKTINQ